MDNKARRAVGNTDFDLTSLGIDPLPLADRFYKQACKPPGWTNRHLK